VPLVEYDHIAESTAVVIFTFNPKEDVPCVQKITLLVEEVSVLIGAGDMVTVLLAVLSHPAAEVIFAK
jgi:hypothetical protein